MPRTLFAPGRHPDPTLWFRGLKATSVSVPAPNYPPTAPSEDALVDALAGVRGSVGVRFRFWHATDTNAPIEDITEAFVVNGCSISLENDRPVLRTATFAIRQALMPVDFDYTSSNVAVQAELRIEGNWWRFQLGLFRLDQPAESLGFEGNDTVNVSASDLGTLLMQPGAGVPYTVARNTNYVNAVETVIDILGLQHVIPPTGYLTPVAFTWQPKTPYLTIANDLLSGINYFPLWSNVYGVFLSRERLSPVDQTPAVEYRTTQEPRMLRPMMTRQKTAVRPHNRIIASIHDPLRLPAAGVADNTDPSSPSSQLNVEVSMKEVNVDRIQGTTLAATYAAYEVRKETGKGESALITTHPDYRRGEQETYVLTFYDHEEETKWRVAGWDMPLGPGSPMTHRLERAPSISVQLTEVTP